MPFAVIKADWIKQGNCVKTPWPELFFDEENRASVTEAKLECASCPVIAECRKYALDTGESHGVWGGLTANERFKLKTRQRRTDYNTRRRVQTGT